MNFIFTMVGEFGYELLNWQGVVRKWASYNKNEKDTITICSRNGLELFYDFADNYVNLSEFDSYNNTIADVYEAFVVTNGNVNELSRSEWNIQRKGEHIEKIKQDVINYVDTFITGDRKFIWSCDYTELNDFHFGKDPTNTFGGIYDGTLRVHENDYRKINLDNYFYDIKEKIQNKVDINLDNPFILCQTAFRTGYEHRSGVKIDHKILFEKIKDKYDILFLDFSSGRTLDSFSQFHGYQSYTTNVLVEQLTLMKLAKYCILTSEGDYRSHFYLPCMVGKDSHVVASRDIMERLSATSCDFYNDNVFTFGGKMINYVYEDVLENINKFNNRF